MELVLQGGNLSLAPSLIPWPT